MFSIISLSQLNFFVFLRAATFLSISPFIIPRHEGLACPRPRHVSLRDIGRQRNFCDFCDIRMLSQK